MKVKELKDMLNRLPDEAEVRVMYRLTSQPHEEQIKEVRVVMTLLPSPGEDFNKVYGTLCLYI